MPSELGRREEPIWTSPDRPDFTWTVTAFYKRESQEKTLPLRLEGAGASARSPAYVMLGGSGFFFLQIHRDRDDALGFRCQQAGW
jgi:hypothetical protein